jgi:hypothetical protein
LMIPNVGRSLQGVFADSLKLSTINIAIHDDVQQSQNRMKSIYIWCFRTNDKIHIIFQMIVFIT